MDFDVEEYRERMEELRKLLCFDAATDHPFVTGRQKTNSTVSKMCAAIRADL